MNKLVFLIFATFSYVYADSESSDSSEWLTVLEERLDSALRVDIQELTKRVNEHCPDVKRRLNATFDDVIQCAVAVDTNNETLCTLLRNNLERCLSPITKLIEGCLPQSSRRIPTIAVRMVTAFIDQSCDSTVEEFLELFNPCDTTVNITSIPSCITALDTFGEYQTRVPTTAKMCSAFTTLKTCALSHSRAACGNPLTVRVHTNSLEALYNATVAECPSANAINEV